MLVANPHNLKLLVVIFITLAFNSKVKGHLSEVLEDVEPSTCDKQNLMSNETLPITWEHERDDEIADEDDESDGNASNFEGESRASDTDSDVVPTWFVAYFGMSDWRNLSKGSFAGVLTRISDTHFLASWRVVRQVDAPPSGCIGGKSRAISKSPRNDAREIEIETSLDSANTPDNADYDYRTYTSAEIRPLSMSIRMYRFMSLFPHSIPTTHRRFVPKDIFQTGPDKPPLQTDSSVGSEHDCKMYHYVPTGPGSTTYKFKKSPIKLGSSSEPGIRPMEFANGRQYCLHDDGAPVICDGKLAYMSFIDEDHPGCAHTFRAMYIAPWREHIIDEMNKQTGTIELDSPLFANPRHSASATAGSGGFGRKKFQRRPSGGWGSRPFRRG